MAPNSFKNTPATNQFQRPSDSNSQDQFSVIDLLLIAVIGQEKKQLKGNKDSFWLISSKGCMLSVEGRQDSEGLRSRSVRSQEAESSASSFFFSQFIGWVNPQCRPMFLRCASLETNTMTHRGVSCSDYKSSQGDIGEYPSQSII